jgi:formate/nitrite transporter FocA (FNT family)
LKSKRWKRWLGEPNTPETYFVYAFLLSIFAGLLFGFVNQTTYYMVSTYLPRPTSAFDIFIHNFQVDLLAIITGGLELLFSNFMTFSVVSGAIVVRHVTLLKTVLALVIVFGSYGILEMAGHLCFGLIGFTFLERILLKKTTQLRRTSLFLLGTALMLVAASIEWWDILQIPKLP